MKKTILLSLILAFVLASLWGCSKGSDSEETKDSNLKPDVNYAVPPPNPEDAGMPPSTKFQKQGEPEDSGHETKD